MESAHDCELTRATEERMAATMMAAKRKQNGTAMVLLIVSVFLTTLVQHVNSFSVKPSWNVNDIAGIWRLTRTTKQHHQDNDERILRIQPDGTFVESNDSTTRLLQGLWEYKESSDLLLLSVESEKDAMLLEGTVEALETESMMNDENTDTKHVQVHLAVEGTVYTGTRLYPKSHPSYFELYQPKKQGTFTLRQVLGSLVVRSTETKLNKPQYKKEDFYNKQFWLAVGPLPNKKRGGTQIKSDKNVDDLMREELVDIRLMAIDFYSNHTFCAQGVNKILRGRYGVNNQDQLWFQVSLFGAGRSVSGSVYSEGKGLTHEDRRSYMGLIQKNEHENTLLVEGNVFFGTDLGSDARPEPVAVFSLKEREQDENRDDDYLYSQLGAFE